MPWIFFARGKGGQSLSSLSLDHLRCSEMIDWSQLHSWIHAMQERHVHAMPLNGLLPQIFGEFARLLHFAVATLHFHAEGPEMSCRHVNRAPKKNS